MKSGWLKAWVHFEKWLELSQLMRVSAGIAGVLLACLALLLCIDAFNRRVFNHPWVGAYDITCVSFVLVTFLAIAYGFMQGRQIRVDILTNRLTGKPSYICDMIASALSGILFAILAWKGWVDWYRALSIGEIRPGYPVPMAIPRGGILVGACLVVAVSIRSFIRSARRSFF